MKNNIEQAIPQGKYLPAVRHGDLIYTSGMTPRKAGELLYSGKILVGDAVEIHRDAVELASLNALGAAQACLNAGEKISQILQLSVYLNAEDEFELHARVADFSSQVLMEHLGDASMGSRVAIGVASLPSNARVEITLIAKVE